MVAFHTLAEADFSILKDTNIKDKDNTFDRSLKRLLPAVDNSTK